MAYSNDTLLEQIKSRALIPTNQSTYTDEDLLEMATDQMQNTVIPMILRTRNEFFVTSSDHAITSSNREIDIPYRAIGLSLRDVVKADGPDEHSLALIAPENKGIQLSATASGFYLRANKVVVLGSWSGTVRLYYHQRPGSLVETSTARKVTAINTGTNTITVASVPTSWTTSTVVDLIRYRPGFDTLNSDLAITAINTNDITLSGLPAGLAVGDWITVSETSPVPQIPVEYYPFLAQSVAAKILEGIGDFEGMKAAMASMQRLEQNAIQLISPRVRGEAKKAVGHRKTSYRFFGGGN